MDARSTERKVKNTARETADRMQESAANAADGLREFQLKLLSATHANVEVFFEYAQDVIRARSVPELIEVSTSHSRRRMEMIADQAREIASAAQKLMNGSTRPLTDQLSDVMNQTCETTNRESRGAADPRRVRAPISRASGEGRIWRECP